MTTRAPRIAGTLTSIAGVHQALAARCGDGEAHRLPAEESLEQQVRDEHREFPCIGRRVVPA
jgi:hypothetical protein